MMKLAITKVAKKHIILLVTCFISERAIQASGPPYQLSAPL